MNQDLDQLWRRSRSGDPQAAAELVTLSYGSVYGWLRRLCGSETDAADLTQKTFAQAWKSLAAFRGESSLLTWLYGIGYHVYLNARRQRRPAPENDFWWENCPDTSPSPFESAAQRDDASQLYAWVQGLEEDLRIVVYLHYYDELTLADTAAALGVATSTVKYRLRQALSILKSKTLTPQPKILKPNFEQKNYGYRTN